jgi:hypothetical protein
MTNTPKVFVSVGTPGNESQRVFRDAMVRSIDHVGLEPRLLTKRDWDYKNPLRGLRRAMSDCSGAIVIAYARYHFPNGEEIRIDGVRSLTDVMFPTSWNQIEAAMAYERGLPLLVVAQSGLHADAVFEGTHDIRPFWTGLKPEVCESDGFIGYLRSWKADVEAYANKAAESSEAENTKISVRKLFMSLEWQDALVVFCTIVGIVLGALTIGYRYGKGQWPFG